MIAKDLYNSELVECTTEHRELATVGCFILQYANLRMLYYEFFDKFSGVIKFEELKLIQIPFI